MAEVVRSDVVIDRADLITPSPATLAEPVLVGPATVAARFVATDAPRPASGNKPARRPVAASMRAVRFAEYGSVDVLQVVDVHKPEPGGRQVLVEVRAAGINPGESKIRTGELQDRWPASFPEGQGSDFAGVIADVGPDVTTARRGDEVLGYTNDRASQAEFVLVDADNLVAKPVELGWPEAGALFVAGTSAYALADAAGVAPGDIVVVSAAAGGVGSLAAQWARTLGADVIGLAGPGNHPWLHRHGIIPVDYAGHGLTDRIREAAGGRTVSAVLDTFGPTYVQVGLDLGVAPERIATIADFGAAERGVTVVQHFAVDIPRVLAELADALVAGRIELPVAATFPLADVREAYQLLEQGHTHGKIVLVP